MGGRERTPLNRQCCTGVGVGTGISVSVGLIFASAYLAPIGLTREGEFSLALSRCFGLMGHDDARNTQSLTGSFTPIFSPRFICM
jgi:hypothetical protein